MSRCHLQVERLKPWHNSSSISVSNQPTDSIQVASARHRPFGTQPYCHGLEHLLVTRPTTQWHRSSCSIRTCGWKSNDLECGWWGCRFCGLRVPIFFCICILHHDFFRLLHLPFFSFLFTLSFFSLPFVVWHLFIFLVFGPFVSISRLIFTISAFDTTFFLRWPWIYTALAVDILLTLWGCQ